MATRQRLPPPPCPLRAGPQAPTTPAPPSRVGPVTLATAAAALGRRANPAGRGPRRSLPAGSGARPRGARRRKPPSPRPPCPERRQRGEEAARRRRCGSARSGAWAPRSLPWSRLASRPLETLPRSSRPSSGKGGDLVGGFAACEAR